MVSLGESGAAVPLLTSAASVPWRPPPPHAGAGNAPHKVFPKAVESAGCSPHGAVGGGTGGRVLLNKSASPCGGCPPPSGPGFHRGKTCNLQKEILVGAIFGTQTIGLLGSRPFKQNSGAGKFFRYGTIRPPVHHQPQSQPPPVGILEKTPDSFLRLGAVQVGGNGAALGSAAARLGRWWCSIVGGLHRPSGLPGGGAACPPAGLPAGGLGGQSHRTVLPLLHLGKAVSHPGATLWQR